MADEVIEEGRRIAESWAVEQRMLAERYLDPILSTDTLFGELAAEVSGPGAMIDDLIGSGQVIYRNVVKRLRGTLCSDGRLRASVDAENAQAGDGIALLAVVASMVQSLGTGLNSLLLAALILRIDLRELCRGVW
jgi:hypothetical protein